MIKLGNIFLDGIPKIVVAVRDGVPNETIKSLNVDVLEIRVDLFSDLDINCIVNSIQKLRKVGSSLILTIRNSESEGGQSGISDEKKMEIFQSVILLVDAIDIELRSPIVSEVIELAKKNKRVIIVSSHNFENTPEDFVLERILQESLEKGADVVKIATQANSIEDVNRLMMFTSKHKEDNVVTMSLGDIGSISRLTFPLVGSLLTYSYIGQPSAPGQVSLERLQQDLRAYYVQYDQYFIKAFDLPDNS